MGNEPFQINNVGKISGDTVQFGTPAEQDPEQDKYGNQDPVLFQYFLFHFETAVPEEKVNKNRCNDYNVNKDKKCLKISRISDSLHAPVSEE